MSAAATAAHYVRQGDNHVRGLSIFAGYGSVERVMQGAIDPRMGSGGVLSRTTDLTDELTRAFRENRMIMYGVARKICGDDAAADVVQEVFIRVWRTSGFDSGRASMRSYLLTVTRGVAIDSLRYRTAIQRRDDRHGRHEPSISDEVDHALLARETRAQVTAAVARLNPNERAVIVAAFYNGLTHREIASRLGLPAGTVKSRIRLAIAKLRVQLGDADDVSPEQAVTGPSIRRPRGCGLPARGRQRARVPR